jgi:hypothetical protein
MINYIILILSFFTILCFADHSLAQEKHWNQIDTDNLTQVEIKDKYYDLLRQLQFDRTKRRYRFCNYRIFLLSCQGCACQINL